MTPTEVKNRDHRHSPGTLLWLLLAFSSVAWTADDVVVIEGARIQGDQELPTVLYLVPWQAPGSRAPEPSEERLMVGDAFPPLEREEFQRLLQYHNRFTSQNISQE